MDPRSVCSPLVALTLACALAAQAPLKRALTHDDYDQWQSIAGTDVTDDGRWVALTLAAQDGDGVLEVHETAGTRVYRHPRGKGAKLTADGRWCVFLIDPPKAETRAYKLAQLKKPETGEAGAAPAERAAPPAGPGGRRGGGPGGRAPGGAAGAGAAAGADDANAPKAALGIMDLNDGKVTVIERVKSFRVPEEGPSAVVYHCEKPPKADPKSDAKADPKSEEKKEEKAEEKPAATSRTTSRGGEARQDHAAKRRQDGTALVLRDLATGAETRVEGVVSYGAPRKRAVVWFATSSKKDDPKVELGLFAWDLKTTAKTTLLAGLLEARGFAFDKKETRLAFTSNKEDFAAEKPVDDLYLWDFEAGPAEKIVTRATDGLPKNRCVSTTFNLNFAKDGSVLLFGAGSLPEPDLPPQLPDEKVTLDLWHWQDGLLQPMQSKRANDLKNRAYACAWLIGERRLVQVGDELLTNVQFCTPDGSRLLAWTSEPYLRDVSWEATFNDVYLVNAFDGTRTKLLTKQRGQAQPSPNGRFVTYFGADRQWHAIDLANRTDRAVTASLGVRCESEDHDQPSPAGAYGVAGFTENDARMLVYDRYDVWSVDPQTGAAACVTDGYGRAEKLTFRCVRLDPEAEYFASDQPLWLSVTDERTRASGFYAESLREVVRPRRLLMLEKSLGALQKAKKAERLFFTQQTYAEFPDLWTAKADFSELHKITAANPQQQQIRWGNAELVQWTSDDGVPLKGVLVKPEGFDPQVKYPMLVYFYERLSQSLHSYKPPAPGTSPNASYYVSNGYLFFEPDIVYTIGHPGESAFKCIVPAVQSLIAKGFVDPKRIGICGHSWGGYQTAYLVTRTNLFAAAESGAPVANMTSAYGGIRWSTGMSRMFQYEQTQSRIGATLWEATTKYLENSPIFHADRVTTPLLILHNDQDGAVPWYQGIELFTALRRLEKEAYLFNYVGEDHGLARRANMKDWSVRMSDFFDHHLKGAPMAKWMRDGVPFVEREKEKVRGVKAVEATANVSEGEKEGR